MIQGKTLRLVLLGVGVLTLSLSGEARSQDNPALPIVTPTDQGDSAKAKDGPGQTQDSQITDADRMLRLEASIGSGQVQLAKLEAELKKTMAEEEAANGDVQKLVTQLEDAKGLLQKAKDSGDSTEIAKQQSLVSELEPKHRLATAEFDLAIQSRRTVQEQILTLQQKIAKDQESLDKLKGVPPPDSTEAGPATPTAPEESDSATDSQQDQPSEPTDAAKTESKAVTVSKELARAQEVVQNKARSVEDIEKDLEAMAVRKALLEKNIALESDQLENGRQRYDVFENSMQVAENELNENLTAGTPASELVQPRTQINDFLKKMRDARVKIRTNTDQLQVLRNELLALQAEEIQLVKQSEKLRREMAGARRSEWIYQARDYLYATVPRVIAILLLAFILWLLVKLIGSRSRGWMVRAGRGTTSERQNRAATLTGVFRNTGNMVIVIGSILMVLDAAGVPITALLGGAGVIGLAVAFGAQSLMKDYFCGFILLLENQYKVNDFVTIGSLSGTVERITLRVTVLRDFEGKVHFIPNGQISSVTNATLDWARAVLEIGVAYEENVDRVIAELKQLTGKLREDPEYGDFIRGDVEMLGVDNLGDSSVVIKFGVKTRPDKKWPVKRELLRRIKMTFDELGIEIPFPHQTIIYREENGSPARRIAEALSGKSDN